MLDYSTLKEVYDPCQGKDSTRKEIFGVGLEGMIYSEGYGYYEDLKDALQVIGKPEFLITHFRSDGDTVILYKWDSKKKVWRLSPNLQQFMSLVACKTYASVMCP